MKNTFTKEHLLFIKKQRTKKILVHASQAGVLLLILGMWELSARLGWSDSFITSSPSRIWSTLASLVAQGTLWRHLWASTWETLAGFAIGTALGYAAAVALWWSSFLKEVFEPYVVVLNSLPKIALGPVIIILVGTDKASIITMAVLISVVITTITMLNGFLSTDCGKALLLRSMGASRLQIFTKLVAPANVPTLMATLKINVGMAWIGSIMGEYLISKEGLGYLLVYGKQVFNLDLVMTCTVVLCALAGAMYAAVALLERLVARRY